ncbi:MAG: hypothetical protein ISR52_00975 [Rhodospirillales bacterium]|nr:hypothetical protein [Rhodospirillales bacterium]
MKISLSKAKDNDYLLSFDDTSVTLDAAGLKSLLLQVTQVLAPGAIETKNALEKAGEYIELIKGANDVGIQSLLQAADEDDILVLLKTGEEDQALQEKFFGNMSEKFRKVYQEDLEFKFNEGVSDQLVNSAIKRLKLTTDTLEEKGILSFDE